MDNVTHTLIGITLGRTIPEKDLKQQKAIIWTAILGNNLPDLDFLMKPFLGAGSLGYLLHHRGYTHTLLAALPLGVFSAIVAMRISRVKGFPNPKLMAVGCLSILLHIAADFCNNYGVHPLSPFFQRWFYGDFIFIVEPLILATLLPLAYFTSRSSWGRALSGGIGLILLGLSVSGIFMPWKIVMGLLIWASFFIWIQRKAQSTLPAILGLIAIYSMFLSGSLLSKSHLKEILKASGNEEGGSSIQIQQLVTTPSPSNPFCWSAVVLSEEGKDYVARMATYSLWPTLFEANRCYFRDRLDLLAPLGPVSSSLSHPGLHWIGEFRRPLSEFKEFKDRYCYFQALLKFSRVPVWFRQETAWIAEDLRYDQGGRNGFTKTRLEAQEACPRDIPNWEEPTRKISP